MSEFKVDDRVEYLGGTNPSWAVPVGKKGTVKDVTFLSNVDVLWDGDYGRRIHSPEYLKKVSDKPALKAGDRVKYTGTMTPHLKGKFGTVDTTYSTLSVRVDWDGGGIPRGVFISSVEKVDGLENLEKVTMPAKPAFSTGDRVIYTGRKGGSGNERLMGNTGTVTAVESSTNVQVKWDDTSVTLTGVYPENLDKLHDFTPGDRVRFTGKHSATFSDDRRIGKLGTVQRHPGYMVSVMWDGEGTCAIHYPENLEIAAAFKVGDKVKYVGKSTRYVNPARIGMIGTVVNVGDSTSPDVASVVVNWDSADWGHRTYKENLEKLEENNNVNDPMNNWRDYLNTRTTRSPQPAVTTVTADPDPVEALRQQADKVEEIADACQEVADKLRDTADALEAISDLADSLNN